MSEKGPCELHRAVRIAAVIHRHIFEESQRGDSLIAQHQAKQHFVNARPVEQCKTSNV